MRTYMERMNYLFSIGWTQYRGRDHGVRWVHPSVKGVFKTVAEVEAYLRRHSDG